MVLVRGFDGCGRGLAFGVDDDRVAAPLQDTITGHVSLGPLSTAL